MVPKPESTPPTSQEQHKNNSKSSPQLNETKYSFVKIMTGSDLSIRRLPMMMTRSPNPGDVVWLTACVHGDEVGGIVIIQEIFKKLRKIPLLKGALMAFPLMNPIGFETGSRNITLTKEDLNRSFPGNHHGSLAERIANKIFTAMAETNPALVLDLHNDWRKSIPYTVIDPDPGIRHKEAYSKAKNFSKKTGFLLVTETKDEEHNIVWRKTLSGSLLLHDIPALTLELGEAYVVNEHYVQLGIESIWNILSHLGMVPPMEESSGYSVPEELKGKFLRYSHRPISSTSGIIRFLVQPGHLITRGQPIARISNTFGKLLETLRAEFDGIVLGYSDSAVAFPGLPVMAFAIKE